MTHTTKLTKPIIFAHLYSGRLILTQILVFAVELTDCTHIGIKYVKTINRI